MLRIQVERGHAVGRTSYGLPPGGREQRYPPEGSTPIRYAPSGTKPPGSQSQVASQREQHARGRKEVAISAVHTNSSKVA